MKPYSPNRRHTNLVMARNLARQQIVLPKPTTDDYRQRALAMSSAPLTGPIGDLKVEREKREREAIERGEPVDRGVGHLPRFDDIMR